jgi:hypothetical protein
MQTHLNQDLLTFSYQIKNIKDYDCDNLLNSEIPEEIILAVLSNFKDKPAKEIIRRILERLQEISNDETKLRKYLRQLGVLSRLRKLLSETIKQVRQMPITYDIKTDFLFQEGARSKTKEIIENMLKAEKLTIEEIASIVGVTVEYVEEIQREGNKK